MRGTTFVQAALLVTQVALFLAGTVPGGDFAERFIIALLSAGAMGFALGAGFLSEQNERQTARQRRTHVYNG